ncbi:MAG: helix-turn-helix domain-containing protein [Microvirga sp.]|nr:helix-turn-helix domain-containing protein [Microvirga sp.]
MGSEFEERRAVNLLPPLPEAHRFQASFTEIGRRVEAYRRGNNKSAGEVAKRLGVSRSNLYRIEQGEIVKIETIHRLAELLDTSINSLLGGGCEFIPRASVFFERVRQIDSEAQKIINFFGPISYLLTSDAYDALLAEMLMETRPSRGRQTRAKEAEGILETLARRKADYRAGRPDLVALVSVAELERLLTLAADPPGTLSPRLRLRYQEVMFEEVERVAHIMEALPLNVSVGLFTEPLHSTPFQITRQVGGRTFLQISPFKLASIPDVNLGVAIITDDADAVRYHMQVSEQLWNKSVKGPDGAAALRDLLARTRSRKRSGVARLD